MEKIETTNLRITFDVGSFKRRGIINWIFNKTYCNFRDHGYMINFHMVIEHISKNKNFEKETVERIDKYGYICPKCGNIYCSYFAQYFCEYEQKFIVNEFIRQRIKDRIMEKK